MYATSAADAHLARTQIRSLDLRGDSPMSSFKAAVPPQALAGEGPGHRLRGRGGERETLDRLVASVRAGDSRALVMRGEAGAGKTALLEYLLERAQGCRVVRAAGVESEMDLPFAGLHQLCAPFLDRIERLPGGRRRARHRAGRGRCTVLSSRRPRRRPACPYRLLSLPARSSRSAQMPLARGPATLRASPGCAQRAGSRLPPRSGDLPRSSGLSRPGRRPVGGPWPGS